MAHDLALEDLAADAWVEQSGVRYDIVTSHHLFSMWNNESGKVRRLCENLVERTGRGADLYFAMSANRNDPTRLDMRDYHQIFAEGGFAVAAERLVWDVYDLDQHTINAMLLKRQETDVIKDCALVHYVKAG